MRVKEDILQAEGNEHRMVIRTQFARQGGIDGRAMIIVTGAGGGEFEQEITVGFFRLPHLLHATVMFQAMLSSLPGGQIHQFAGNGLLHLRQQHEAQHGQ